MVGVFLTFAGQCEYAGTFLRGVITGVDLALQPPLFAPVSSLPRVGCKKSDKIYFFPLICSIYCTTDLYSMLVYTQTRWSFVKLLACLFDIFDEISSSSPKGIKSLVSRGSYFFNLPDGVEDIRWTTISLGQIPICRFSSLSPTVRFN